jgi:hypothetical protein
VLDLFGGAGEALDGQSLSAGGGPSPAARGFCAPLDSFIEADTVAMPHRQKVQRSHVTATAPGNRDDGTHHGS